MQSQPCPLKLFSGCELIHIWSEKPFCFYTKRLHFVACWFSFTLRWNDCVKIKLRSEGFLKFLLKIRLKRETNLMQACSASQHQVIMPSWLSKVPSWLRKNALCLSQSALSNFALHVIMIFIHKSSIPVLHGVGLRWQILPLANLENTKLNKDASGTLKINDDIIPIPFHVPTLFVLIFAGT